MNTTTIEPRIYVASLSDYNNGILHGTWIDLSGKSVEDVEEEIKEMLKASKDPYAEEWSIHDFESMPDLGENPDLKTVVEMAMAVEEHGEPFLAYVKYQGLDSISVENFKETYQGEHDSVEDYAEQLLDDTGGLQAIPENLRYYFDYEKYARDLELGGDIYTIDSPSGVYVFLNY